MFGNTGLFDLEKEASTYWCTPVRDCSVPSVREPGCETLRLQASERPGCWAEREHRGCSPAPAWQAPVSCDPGPGRWPAPAWQAPASCDPGPGRWQGKTPPATSGTVPNVLARGVGAHSCAAPSMP